MRRLYIIIGSLGLISSLIAGCGCLAADSYDKSACQKYSTDWPHHYYDEDYTRLLIDRGRNVDLT